jgi:hypothetical protein
MMMMMSGRKYLAAFAAGGVVTAVVMAWAVHALPMQIYEESYPMYAYEREVEQTPAREPATTLIVGDSRAKASLLPDRLGSGSVSLTLPGASPVELYHAADRYLGRHPAPRNVVLSISAVHFGDAFIFWERPIKFGYLDQAAVDEVFAQARRLHDPTFGTPWQARFNYLLHRLNSPHLYLPELRRALFHPHGRANQQLLAQLERERGHCSFGTAARSDGLAYEDFHDRFDPSPTYDHYFRKLIDRLRASGAKVVFMAMPLNQHSRQQLKPGFVEAYDRYFAGIARDYPDVEVRARWPELDDQYFGDANHVNARGSELVTGLARQLLRL